MLKYRFVLLVLGHISVFLFTGVTAFALRFEFQFTDSSLLMMQQALPVFLCCKMLCFYVFRSFHGWWRYVAFSDIRALGNATLVSLLVVIILDHFLLPFQIPRSVVLIDALLSVVVLGSIRSTWRLLNEEVRPLLSGRKRLRTVIAGTSDTAVRLANQLRSHPEMGFEILGHLKSQKADRRTWLTGLPVLGSIDELDTQLGQHRVEQVLVPAGELTGVQMRQLMTMAEECSFVLRVIPPLGHYLSGNQRIPVREVDINDLLRREPVELDDQSIGDFLRGHRILVTGAGGSIGSEICRQLLRYEPAELILVGRGENRIFAIEQELLRCNTTTEFIPVIGDITDEDRMRWVFEQYRPEIVFHAAAHKHVPLMERNVGEAVKNNILGTKIVADMAHEWDARAFVLISTDKAVNPSSVMGASKQMAERYIHEVSLQSSTKFVTVRFGNVLGSAGSVVPTFRDQIQRGGPLTVTDPEMRRYFMTIPEASRLVLQAAAMGSGGEIFVLDMGQPIRVVDLAKDMIRLSGLPESAIDIVFTGIRPGEKLYEELYFSEEESVPTSHPKVRAALHRADFAASTTQAVRELTSARDDAKIQRELLQRFIPEYTGLKTTAASSTALPHTPNEHSTAQVGAVDPTLQR